MSVTSGVKRWVSLYLSSLLAFLTVKFCISLDPAVTTRWQLTFLTLVCRIYSQPYIIIWISGLFRRGKIEMTYTIVKVPLVFRSILSNWWFNRRQRENYCCAKVIGLSPCNLDKTKLKDQSRSYKTKETVMWGHNTCIWKAYLTT